MYTLFPLDEGGTIYTLQDEDGRPVGSGTREVCQTILSLLNRSPLLADPARAARWMPPAGVCGARPDHVRRE